MSSSFISVLVLDDHDVFVVSAGGKERNPCLPSRSVAASSSLGNGLMHLGRWYLDVNGIPVGDRDILNLRNLVIGASRLSYAIKSRVELA